MRRKAFNMIWWIFFSHFRSITNSPNAVMYFCLLVIFFKVLMKGESGSLCQPGAKCTKQMKPKRNGNLETEGGRLLRGWEKQAPGHKAVAGSQTCACLSARGNPRHSPSPLHDATYIQIVCRQFSFHL